MTLTVTKKRAANRTRDGRPLPYLSWLAIAALGCWLGLNSKAADADDTPRKAVPAFSLPSTDNSVVTLPDQSKAVVVCFLGTECPLARLYAPRLQKLADQYESKGVVFIGVDSNLQDTLAEVERFRTSNNLRFPIGMDYDQKVAESLGPRARPKSSC